MYSFPGIIDLFIFFLIRRRPHLGLDLFFEQLELLLQPEREVSSLLLLLLALLSAISSDRCSVMMIELLDDVFFVVEVSSFSLVMINLLKRKFFILVVNF